MMAMLMSLPWGPALASQPSAKREVFTKSLKYKVSPSIQKSDTFGKKNQNMPILPDFER